MNIRTLRGLVFSLLFFSLILPLYLTIRFHLVECLFLYIPVFTFWSCFIYDQIEETNKGVSNE